MSIWVEPNNKLPKKKTFQFITIKNFTECIFSDSRRSAERHQDSRRSAERHHHRYHEDPAAGRNTTAADTKHHRGGGADSDHENDDNSRLNKPRDLDYGSPSKIKTEANRSIEEDVEKVSDLRTLLQRKKRNESPKEGRDSPRRRGQVLGDRSPNTVNRHYGKDDDRLLLRDSPNRYHRRERSPNSSERLQRSSQDRFDDRRSTDRRRSISPRSVSRSRSREPERRGFYNDDRIERGAENETPEAMEVDERPEVISCQSRPDSVNSLDSGRIFRLGGREVG